MDQLTEAMAKMVAEAVEKSKPQQKENFLSKKDAVKLLAKFARKYACSEYLTKGDAAAYLDMHPTTFWKLRQKYPVKCYTFESTQRIKRSDLDKWAEDNSVKGYT